MKRDLCVEMYTTNSKPELVLNESLDFVSHNHILSSNVSLRCFGRGMVRHPCLPIIYSNKMLSMPQNPDRLLIIAFPNN